MYIIAMAMQNYISFLLLVCAFGVLANSEFGTGSVAGGNLPRSCVESEKQALLLFKNSLVDDSSSLSSWVGDDCCAWEGIGCDNITNQVTQLEVRNVFLTTSSCRYAFAQDGSEISAMASHAKKYSVFTIGKCDNDIHGDQLSLISGASNVLTSVDLSNNRLSGKLPRTFQNFSQLIAIDLGKNNLSDVLPTWTAEQSQIKYLILRSNNFYGEIPTQLCQHKSLEVLNLADNQITGNIPSCFGNFSAMVRGLITYNFLNYSTRGAKEFEIVDETKGYEQDYTSTLKYLVSIDLSMNNISGEIPKELMDLHGLLNLNLAGNHLSGKIPNEIGKMENLIFLDLSRNELHGPIPHSLSYLNFLSQMNLSFNDLSGRIPSGYQLQTLDDPSIYAGNKQLCGPPILKPCAADTASHSVNDHNEADSDLDSDDEHMWIFAGLGPGFAVGFLGFCFTLHFSNISIHVSILANRILRRYR
ncbi:leucine-rich repeat receptor-like serine/threonine-protein kinase SKM1 isoform X5 [Daucus carota subsp. sativus]|uniref:leucine-rich repeat receptor-like serine/threonine-protein kinase SKM1 isoform X5 n=1 Tax=Daucus carota subsp. sativus TaxID=79200 RepID=UPI003083087B